MGHVWNRNSSRDNLLTGSTVLFIGAPLLPALFHFPHAIGWPPLIAVGVCSHIASVCPWLIWQSCSNTEFMPYMGESNEPQLIFVSWPIHVVTESMNWRPWVYSSNQVLSEVTVLGFPGGSVVKIPPASAGDSRFDPSVVWEDPTCRGATKAVCHNY